MELSKYLLKAREDKGITQRELASQLGIASAQLISNWERGLCAPPIAKLNSLTKVLGMKFDPTFELVMQYKASKARLKATSFKGGSRKLAK